MVDMVNRLLTGGGAEMVARLAGRDLTGGPARRPVLAIDPCEELFTLADADERGAFVALLGDALAAEHPDGTPASCGRAVISYARPRT